MSWSRDHETVQYAERGRVHIFKLLEILVWQQEQKELLEYEKTFRRKKEEERAQLNYANPRSTTNSNKFVNFNIYFYSVLSALI